MSQVAIKIWQKNPSKCPSNYVMLVDELMFDHVDITF